VCGDTDVHVDPSRLIGFVTQAVVLVGLFACASIGSWGPALAEALRVVFVAAAWALTLGCPLALVVVAIRLFRRPRPPFSVPEEDLAAYTAGRDQLLQQKAAVGRAEADLQRAVERERSSQASELSEVRSRYERAAAETDARLEHLDGQVAALVQAAERGGCQRRADGRFDERKPRARAFNEQLERMEAQIAEARMDRQALDEAVREARGRLSAEPCPDAESRGLDLARAGLSERIERADEALDDALETVDSAWAGWSGDLSRLVGLLAAVAIQGLVHVRSDLGGLEALVRPLTLAAVVAVGLLAWATGRAWSETRRPDAINVLRAALGEDLISDPAMDVWVEESRRDRLLSVGAGWLIVAIVAVGLIAAGGSGADEASDTGSADSAIAEAPRAFDDGAASSAPAVGAAQPDAWVVASSVNVRRSPSSSSEAFAILGVGAPVWIAESANGWCSLEVEGAVAGWASCSMLGAETSADLERRVRDLLEADDPGALTAVGRLGAHHPERVGLRGLEARLACAQGKPVLADILVERLSFAGRDWWSGLRRDTSSCPPDAGSVRMDEHPDVHWRDRGPEQDVESSRLTGLAMELHLRSRAGEPAPPPLIDDIVEIAGGQTVLARDAWWESSQKALAEAVPEVAGLGLRLGETTLVVAQFDGRPKVVGVR